MKNEYILSVGILVAFDILVLKFIGTAGIDIINSVLLLIVVLNFKDKSIGGDKKNDEFWCSWLSELSTTGFRAAMMLKNCFWPNMTYFWTNLTPSDDEYELYNFNRNDIADKHYYEGRICNGMDDS